MERRLDLVAALLKWQMLLQNVTLSCCCVFLCQVDCSRFPNATDKEGKDVLVCNKDLRPICGTDGVTYTNDCLLCAYSMCVLQRELILQASSCA